MVHTVEQVVVGYGVVVAALSLLLLAVICVQGLTRRASTPATRRALRAVVPAVPTVERA